MVKSIISEATKIELIAAGFNKKDIIIKNGKNIRLLTAGIERKLTIDKLVKNLNYIYDPNHPGSSLGAVIAPNQTVITIKPKEKQGNLSSGIDNELFLETSINNYIKQNNGNPITVKFVSKTKKIKFNKITSIEGVGRSVGRGYKSDIRLLNGTKVVSNLSLKKDRAVVWESADKRYKELVIKLISKITSGQIKGIGLKPTTKEGIFHLYDTKQNISLSGLSIINLPNLDGDSIVFGKDIPKTSVIIKTFEPKDFKFDGKILTVTTSSIFNNIDEINETEHEPFLFIRHDITRPNTKGLRPLVNQKKYYYKNNKLQGNTREIEYKQIIK